MRGKRQFDSTYWTKARVLDGLQRFYRATGEAPLATSHWHELVDLRYERYATAAHRTYPSAYAILRWFSSFREAWTAAGVVVDRGWEPWTADEEWYLQEAAGLLPRAQIAEDLGRSDASIKRRLYDLGLTTRSARGWTLNRVERVAQVPRHVLVKYLDRGELPYLRGNKCVFVDPGDLTVVSEIDWTTPPAELAAAVRASLQQRIVTTLSGCDWRVGRPYQAHSLLKTDRHYRWGTRLAKPGPKPIELDRGDWVRVRRPVPQRPGIEGRTGLIHLVYWTVNRQVTNTTRTLPEPTWMAKVEFKKERRHGNDRPRVHYSLPLDALEWLGPGYATTQEVA